MKSGSRAASLFVGCVAAALGARFFWVTWHYSVNLPFYDQWDYLASFFRGNPGWAELFLWQHGPHRQGIGLFADKLLFPATHWNLRFDSLEAAAAIFLAMLLALWLKYKISGAWSYYDAAIPFLFLTLAQGEILVLTPNPAHSPIPLLLLVLYCHAFWLRDWRRRYGLMLAVNLLAIYTGFGFFLGVVTIGVLLLELHWKFHAKEGPPWAASVSALAVAVGSLGSFFIGYRWETSVDCQLTDASAFSYLWFATVMDGSFLAPPPARLRTMTLMGAAVLLGAIVVLGRYMVDLLTRKGDLTTKLTGAVLIGYSLLYTAMTAFGRTCLGTAEGAPMSRYMTLLIPMFFGLYLFLLGAGRRFVPVLVVFLLFLLPASLIDSRGLMARAHDKKLEWANCYRETEDIARCNDRAEVNVLPNATSSALREKLDYLKANRLSFFADEAH